MLLKESQLFTFESTNWGISKSLENIELETGLFMETHSCPISRALSLHI